MATKLVRVDETSPRIPEQMRRAVAYLNEVLKACPEELTQLLDKHEQHLRYYGLLPVDVVIREKKDGTLVLTAFGVLAGLINIAPFRIVMQWDGDETTTPIDRFIILEVL